MSVHWLLLLLPVAAASGWAAARYSSPRSSAGREPPVDRYLEGVRYLLDDQTDRALQAFIEVVEIDHETFETHLILGRLFRRRGEVDRAIRIHQNLAARPTLTDVQRARATFEMGRDFLLAGVLDRAEAVFRELVDSPSMGVPALEGLRSVYETQRDWVHAVETGLRLKAHGVASEGLRIAHYECELALLELEQDRPDRALSHVDRALGLCPGLSRALLLRAEVAERNGDVALSIRLGREAIERTPALATLVVPKLERLYLNSGLPGATASLEDTLQALASTHKITVASIALMRLYRRTNRLEEALTQLHRILAQRPVPTSGLLEAVRWMKILPAVHTYSSEFAAFEKALMEQLRSQPLYQCTNCGYQGRAHVWQCPSCRRWDTLRGIDLDLDQPPNQTFKTP
ncbi:Heat shock (predicted periplasmic) protein YciM, precursor [Thioalkalivibrio nitratireducens DSM 14787]|uniref:Lipopolysaccharide assembly protein B n=1 Tax=Thioalkalivibrio nitratireducens (strain DSM 14787 / UNIQEM 213 / ALEN2) TaxID=1255043 RepID=L0DWY1_THIND|nr:tetratricopeptide repeat protein [Thioalkalivibrio nitratireducens]AGA33465.1 Heat shock (predicted periplasmic) protein YciM, precursor [Thioalkalivibrio nitratireducens DSM 14787]